MTNPSLTDILANLSVDVFNIKDKVNDQEYLDMNNKLKEVKDKYDIEKVKYTKVFKAYYQLQQDYINLSKSFNHMYMEYNDVQDDTFIDFNLQ